MKKTIYICAIVLFFGIFAFAAWKLIGFGTEYRKGVKEYERLEQYVQIPQTEPAATVKKTEDAAPEETQPAETAWPKVDFAALQMLNPDVVGWIYIDGTQVNYPIVQADDNDYYLYRLISGESNSSGSIFLDAGASELFASRNNPIYGHNMKNGTMFRQLHKYEDRMFFEENREVIIYQPDQILHYQIFAAYVYDNRHLMMSFDFEDPQVFEDYIESIFEKKSMSNNIDDSIPITAEDKIITLSTCNGNSEQRYLVQAVLVSVEN